MGQEESKSSSRPQCPYVVNTKLTSESVSTVVSSNKTVSASSLSNENVSAATSLSKENVSAATPLPKENVSAATPLPKENVSAATPLPKENVSAASASNENHELKLLWAPEIKPLKLRNYQTGETAEVTGPQSTAYTDCRQHLCTSTFMPVSAHPHQNPAKEKTGDELESLDPNYVVKEAQAYLSIFHQDMKTSEVDYQKRLEQVKSEIERTGTYKHTTEELEYGCQLSWRNSSRCINRLYWRTFKCVDRRDISTNDQMFQAICDHIRFAFNGGTLQASVLVMNPKSRCWSTQYFRYACYEQSDGTFLGDPTNQELTKVALDLGWNKPEEERTPWDLLPIIVQADLNEAPSVYELPDDLRYQVTLSHPNPKYDQAIKSLGLRWFAQPYVSDKAIEIGGIFYRCVPFSGWFMQSEIGRNLCDVQRYNLIPQIAKLLDLDITAAANSQLNVDRIYVEMNAAILYSFEKAKIAIVDHHTAATGFMKFMKAEIKQRGNTPGDWVWIVPPLSGGMSPVFHQEMLNYVLKPRIVDQRDPWHSYTPMKAHKDVLEMPTKKRVRHRWLILRAARAVIGFAVVAMKQRISVNVLYASSSGTAYSYAQQMHKRLLHIGYNPVLMELDSFQFLPHKNMRSINLIITSTFGQGNAPDGGTKVEEWLENPSENMENIPRSGTNVGLDANESEAELRAPLMWCTYAVCAIGSSAYPFYCGFGELVDTKFEELGGTRLIPLAMCDALNQQFKSYNDWEALAIKTLRTAYPHACLRPEDVVASSQRPGASLARQQTILEEAISFNTSLQPAHVSLEFHPDKKKEKIDLADQKGPFTKDKPYHATVLQNIELIGNQNSTDYLSNTKQESLVANPEVNLNQLSNSSTSDGRSIDEEHSVRLVVFDTPHLSYNPGDHVCVLPENTISNVNEFLLACGWQPDDPRLDQHCSLASFTNGKYDTIREILTNHVDLSVTPQPHMLSTIASYASDPSEQRQLLELSKGKIRYDDWKINAPTIKEMLDQFPSVKIPISEMIQLLPNLQPRYYSISSSTRLNPNQLHVTVSVVTYATVRGIVRKGLCSSFLQQTIPASSSTSSKENASIVRLFIIPNAHFRLPGQEKLPKEIPNEKALFVPLHNPVLMFAVGSGMAPFRSFWQELQVLQRLKGNSGIKIERVLFFGCRTRRDYLFAKELQELSKEDKENNQILTSVFPVFSRDHGAAKRYIQDAMLDHEKLIYSIITNDNASIYMCGSTRACQGIEAVLMSILETSSNGLTTAEDAQLRIKKLKQTGKIRQDMFG